MFFLPQDTLRRTLAKRMFEVITQKEGMEVLGWRDVPFLSMRRSSEKLQ